MALLAHLPGHLVVIAMPDENPYFDGNAWDARVKRWLRLRYPGGEFVSFPAGHGGDRGLEGFSTDGRVYQCYSSRDGLDIGPLYEKQRNKLTEDVNKFIDNEEELSAVFPPGFKVSLYCFVVPKHESFALVKHAASKTEEIRSKNLEYVGTDFRIVIWDIDEFEVERRTELECRLAKLPIDFEEINPGAVAHWAATNDDGVKNIDRKVRIYTSCANQSTIIQIRDKWIEAHIKTENALAKLRSKSEDIWEKLQKTKRTQEFLLFRRYGTNSGQFHEANTAAEHLAQEMVAEVPNLDRVGAELLATGIVGEWLHKCSLDFPERNDGQGI